MTERENTDRDALKPCPFCNQPAEVREWDWPYVRFQVRCSYCRAMPGNRKADRSATIAVWNTRTSDRDRTIAEQAAVIERERNDAERYHWLRDHSCPPHNFYIAVPDEFHGVRYKPAEVDAYIDEARAALQKDQTNG